MFVLVVAALALFGGTTWFALQQSVARDPAHNRRLTGGGLALCLLTVVAALVAAAVGLIASG